MELFREMEKYLPKLERHFHSFMQENIDCLFDWTEVCQEIVYFDLSRNGLREGDRLYELFAETGIKHDSQMYAVMTEWLKRYILMQQNRKSISRADTFPAQESERQ